MTTQSRPIPLSTDTRNAAEPQARRTAKLGRGLRREVRRRPVFVFFTALLLVIMAAAVAAPVLPIADPEAQSLSHRLQEPMTRGADGTLHLAGTDQLGRDVFSRTIYAARISIGIAVLAAAISGAAGTALGLLAGYRGGVVDMVIMRAADMQMSFPPMLLAIFLLYLIGPSLQNLVILLVIFSWAGFARMTRAETLSLRRRAFVEGAVALGARDGRILFRHILPHLVPVLAVLVVFDFASVMMAEAGLSFLGFGVQAPDWSWGRMLAESRDHVYSGGWWLFLIPGMALFVTVLSANLASRWGQEVFKFRRVD